MSGGSSDDPYYQKDPPTRETNQTAGESEPQKKRGGWKLSDETRERMSRAKKGKPQLKKRGGWKLSDETKKRLSESKTGKKRGPLNEQWRKNISEALKGKKKKPISDEDRKKLSDAHMGKKLGPHSEEHRRNISKAKMGKKYGPLSLEHRMKISLAHGGKGDYWSWSEDGSDHIQRLRQSRAARERDDYTCQCCGKRDRKKVQGHHIFPVKYWWRMEYYPLDWVTTLCTDCHPYTHKGEGPIKWPRRSPKSEMTPLDEYLRDDEQQPED